MLNTIDHLADHKHQAGCETKFSQNTELLGEVILQTTVRPFISLFIGEVSSERGTTHRKRVLRRITGTVIQISQVQDTLFQMQIGL